jgi:hypothetical protein
MSRCSGGKKPFVTVTHEGAEEKAFDAVWAAAFLATAGAGLVGAALVARRRL